MLAYYRNLIYFAVVLGFLSYSHFGYTNVTVENAESSTEASTPSSDNTNNEAEATNPVQEMKTNIMTSDTFRMPDYRFEFTGLFGFADINNTLAAPLQWNLSADVLYHIQKHDRWISSLGLRYRTFFSHPGAGDDTSNSIYSGEFTVHQLLFLTQTLIFFENKSLLLNKVRGFLGFIFGLHLWKSLKTYLEDDEHITSSEFLWNSISYQVGIKSGIILSSHFAFITEIGFDQLVFGKYNQKINGDDTRVEQDTRLPFSNIYITLGISYFL